MSKPNSIKYGCSIEQGRNTFVPSTWGLGEDNQEGWKMFSRLIIWGRGWKMQDMCIVRNDLGMLTSHEILIKSKVLMPKLVS